MRARPKCRHQAAPHKPSERHRSEIVAQSRTHQTPSPSLVSLFPPCLLRRQRSARRSSFHARPPECQHLSTLISAGLIPRSLLRKSYSRTSKSLSFPIFPELSQSAGGNTYRDFFLSLEFKLSH